MPADGVEMFMEEVGASDVSFCSRLQAELGIPEVPQTLPADFRVQVQMLYWMADQRRLLEKMLDLQLQVEGQVQGIKHDVAIGQRAVSASIERTEKKVDDLHERKWRSNGEHLQGNAHHQNQHCMERNCGQCCTADIDPDITESTEQGLATGSHKKIVFDLTSNGSVCALELLADGASPAPITETESDQAPLRKQNAVLEIRQTSCVHCQALAYAVVTSTAFDIVCGVVIAANACWAGVAAQTNIKYAISHIGQPPLASTGLQKGANHCFFLFYLTELLLRLVGFGKKFFTDPEHRSWNFFDVALVASGAYDLGMELSGIKPMNLTAVRVLRLAKVVKMLRVVRVLRLFKEMRAMLKSITQSLMLLMWALVVLAVTLYIFSLCFLFSVTAYLHDTPENAIDSDTRFNIETYWKSLPMAVVSLFMTLSGGADWEPISQPFRMMGGPYYVMFLIYVAFGVITVMNVLTGLIVDNSMKAVLEDENDVCAAIFEEEGRAISALTSLYDEDPEFQVHSTINWKPFEADLRLKGGVAHQFLKTFEIKATDALRVFNLLSHNEVNGRVTMDAFIAGCSKARSSTLGLEMVSLSHATCKMQKQLAVLIESVRHEPQCDEIDASSFRAAGQAETMC